jgi:hypothetical protein
LKTVLQETLEYPLMAVQKVMNMGPSCVTKNAPLDTVEWMTLAGKDVLLLYRIIVA